MGQRRLLLGGGDSEGEGVGKQGEGASGPRERETLELFFLASYIITYSVATLSYDN